jgi:hypothetical protein
MCNLYRGLSMDADQIINLTKTIKGNNIDKYNFDITTWNLDSILKKNLKKNISELKLCFVGFLAHHLHWMVVELLLQTLWNSIKT